MSNRYSRVVPIFDRIPRPIIALGLVALLLILLWWAYSVPWTGFGANPAGAGPGDQGKTLWDWLQLLLLPAILAGGLVWFQRALRRYETQAANREAETNELIARENRRDQILQSYFDRMTELLLDHKLRDSKPEEQVRAVARARTLTVLRQLDHPRNRLVIQFLRELGLIAVSNIVSLREADLSGVDLAGTNLTKVDLGGSNLEGASLVRANLMQAILNAANLSGANLRAANLNYADVRRADLRRTNLREASLFRAYLFNARFEYSILLDANLSMAELKVTNFANCDLSRANLSAADLSNAHLFNANLTGADLTNADLTRAIIINADLTRANVTGAKLAAEQLARAKSVVGMIRSEAASESGQPTPSS
jgi:pentapeptide repeat protein